MSQKESLLSHPAGASDYEYAQLDAGYSNNTLTQQSDGGDDDYAAAGVIDTTPSPQDSAPNVHQADGDVAPHEVVDPAPKDTANIVLIMLFTVGLATFFCSTAILASNDYYTSTWGSLGESLIFVAPFLIQICTPFVQMLLLKYQDRITFTSRIEFSFLCNTLVAIVFPLQVKLLPDSLSFPIACVCILVVGINNSVLKVSLLSLTTAAYSPNYMQIFLIGQAASPLAVIILKMFLKYTYAPAHGASDDEVKQAAALIALVFFIISACMTTTAALFFKIARQSAFSRYYFPSFKARYQKYLDDRKKYQEYKDAMAKQQQQSQINSTPTTATPTLTQNEAQDLMSSHTDMQTGEMIPELSEQQHGEQTFDAIPTKIRKLEVLSKVKYYMCLIFLTTIPPCCVYPSLLNVMNPNYPGTLKVEEVWNHLIMMLLYCCFDIIGRAIPLSLTTKLIPISKIEWAIGARYVLHVVLVVCVYTKMSSIIHAVLTCVVALTQAMCLVRLLTSYKLLCKLGDAEGNVAGSLAAISIASGVLTAYIIAFVTDALYHAIF